MAIFEEARQELGLGEIQDTGLPDWTDGYDLADYIEENGLDYDGIILDEGGDMVNGEPVSRGLSYVVRDSAQIKSADPVTYDGNGNVIPLSQRFDSSKQDIRYSRVSQYTAAELKGIEKNWKTSWAFHNEIINYTDLEKIRSAIAEIWKQGYNGYNFKGKFKEVPLTGNKFALVSGSYNNPTANYIVENNLGFADDDYDLIRSYLAYEGARETQRILERVYADESLQIHSLEDHGFDGWKNNGGARNNRGASAQSIAGRQTNGGDSQQNLSFYYSEAIRKGHPRRAREYMKQYAVQAGYTEEQIKKMPTTVYKDGQLVDLHDRFADTGKTHNSRVNDSSEYAPKFYSKMGRVLDGINQNKLGAGSVVNMLRGKGVKAEEIKWSGIEHFLSKISEKLIVKSSKYLNMRKTSPFGEALCWYYLFTW